MAIFSSSLTGDVQFPATTKQHRTAKIPEIVESLLEVEGAFQLKIRDL